MCRAEEILKSFRPKPHNIFQTHNSCFSILATFTWFYPVSKTLEGLLIRPLMLKQIVAVMSNILSLMKVHFACLFIAFINDCEWKLNIRVKKYFRQISNTSIYTLCFLEKTIVPYGKEIYRHLIQICASLDKNYCRRVRTRMKCSTHRVSANVNSDVTLRSQFSITTLILTIYFIWLILTITNLTDIICIFSVSE